MRANVAEDAGGRRLLITGVSGLLGANLAVAAVTRFSVAGIHRSHPIAIPGMAGEAIDLRDGESLFRCLDAFRPAILVHLAPQTNVDYCESHREEAATLNVEVTRHLAQWAAAHRARLLLMSTDSVFDGRRGAYAEGDEPHPINFYAETKLAAEEIVRRLVPDHLIVRASFYGWNAQDKKSLAEWILQRLEGGQALPGFSDVIFSPLLANTLAGFMLDLLDREAGGIVHLASSDFLSKHDFAMAVAEVFALPKGLIRESMLADAALVAPRPRDTHLCVERARREFGIVPPTVREDLLHFKSLRDGRYPARLRSMSVESP